MPELHDMLTQAVPPVEPGFDEADVRARAAAAERRQRRVAIGSMLAVVALIAVLVVPALLPDQPQSVLTGLGQGELVPLSQWPSSIEFAGVEVGVYVSDAPDEAIQGRAALGAGEAGLNTEPDGPDEEPGVAGYRARTWFGCGTGQVVRMVEIGRAPDAPAFEIAGPRGRWLPPGALLEAARQLTEEMGCTPEAPPGTPQEERGGQPWLMPFVAAIDDAGLATCCFHGFTPPRDAEATHAGHVSDWGVLLSGDDGLSLSVGGPDTIFWDDTAAELVGVGEGVAANWAVSNLATDVLWFVCDGVSVLATPTSGEAESVGRFVDRIGCAPEIHPSFTRSLALSELLRDVGGVVVATTPDPVIGISRVRLDGVVLEVRSGQLSQVGLSEGTVVELNRGWQALDPSVDGFGAIAQCAVTHAIQAEDEAGAELALALAERIVGHPDCGLDGGVELPTTPTSPPELASEVDADVPPEAAAVIDALREAGRRVDSVIVEPDATTFHLQPAIPRASPVWVSIERRSWTVTAESQLVGLAGGEAVVLDGGVLGFRCADGWFRTTGPDAGGSELEWVADLPVALGCDPMPPGLARTVTAAGGTQIERGFSIREARLEQAITALGLEPCCGEPSHGGSGAATGMVWEGTEVFISAGPPMTDDPDYQAGQIIEFAGGQADLGDGDGLPLIAFDCGDTNYQLSHDSTNADVQILAAEALVGQLDCAPRVGPAN